MNKIEYIKSLGWIFKECWNNREIYILDKYLDCPYVLFEHQGEIGILHNGKFDYYDLREEDIRKFTKALYIREIIIHNPDEYKVGDLFRVRKAIDNILDSFAIRKKKDNKKIFKQQRNNYGSNY